MYMEHWPGWGRYAVFRLIRSRRRRPMPTHPMWKTIPVSGASFLTRSLFGWMTPQTGHWRPRYLFFRWSTVQSTTGPSSLSCHGRIARLSEFPEWILNLYCSFPWIWMRRPGWVWAKGSVKCCSTMSSLIRPYWMILDPACTWWFTMRTRLLPLAAGICWEGLEEPPGLGMKISLFPSDYLCLPGPVRLPSKPASLKKPQPISEMQSTPMRRHRDGMSWVQNCTRWVMGIHGFVSSILWAW